MHSKTALLAENGKLKNLDAIVKKFMQLTNAHRGDVKVLVTTVMVRYSFNTCYLLNNHKTQHCGFKHMVWTLDQQPLPPAEEKELTETLQEIIGAGKKITVEQKVCNQTHHRLVIIN